jgi:hypothetical protein
MCGPAWKKAKDDHASAKTETHLDQAISGTCPSDQGIALLLAPDEISRFGKVQDGSLHVADIRAAPGQEARASGHRAAMRLAEIVAGESGLAQETSTTTCCTATLAAWGTIF